MKKYTFFIDELQLSFLKTLPGTVTEHLRRAVDKYIEETKKLKVSTSLSYERPEGDKPGI